MNTYNSNELLECDYFIYTMVNLKYMNFILFYNILIGTFELLLLKYLSKFSEIILNHKVKLVKEIERIKM